MKKLLLLIFFMSSSIINGCSEPGDLQIFTTTSLSEKDVFFLNLATQIPGFYPELLPEYDPDLEPNLPSSGVDLGYIWPYGYLPAEPVFSKPQFIDYDRLPQGYDDNQLFEDAKCGYSNDSTYLDCTFTSPLAGFQCYAYRKPRGIGINLTPQYPLVAICYYIADNESDWEQVFHIGCWAAYYGYIFLVDGEYQLIRTLEEMQTIFAPITSPQEALEFARMVTGLGLVYQFPRFEDNYIIYYSDIVQDSHALEIENGYLVNLYHFEGCSCDTFLTTQIDIFISFDAQLEWRDATPTYLELSPGMCMD